MVPLSATDLDNLDTLMETIATHRFDFYTDGKSGLMRVPIAAWIRVGKAFVIRQ